MAQLGRAPRIGLVGCGKKKQEGVHAVRELYTSTLFRAALHYSEATADETYLLSARHGVLHPDDVIESYDVALSDMSLLERHAWGHGVVFHLQTLFPRDLPFAFSILAGAAYAAPIREAACKEKLSSWTFSEPMTGLGLCQRLRWLAEQRRALSGSPGARL